MKTVYLLFFLMGFAGVAQAQNRDEESSYVTESRVIGDFSKLSVSIAADVTLKQSDSFRLVVSGRRCILSELLTKVNDGHLNIRLRERCNILTHVEKVKITIEAPRFDDLDFSGVGNVRTEGPIKGSKLTLDLSGANQIYFNNLDFDTLDVSLSGVGSISLGGKAHWARLELSGTGNMDTYDLKLQKARCEVSGLGTLQCNVEDDLSAYVSGLGKIVYAGQPKNLYQSVSGLGRVRRM